jgi:hypothetical protein
VPDADVTRLLVRLRRSGRAPKTIRNILSRLHSVFELALRRRGVSASPCKLVDATVGVSRGGPRLCTPSTCLTTVAPGFGLRAAGVAQPDEPNSGAAMADPVPAGGDVSAGTYRCTNCGYELQVGSTDNLPPCPSCHNGQYETLSGGDSADDPYPDPKN